MTRIFLCELGVPSTLLRTGLGGINILKLVLFNNSKMRIYARFDEVGLFARNTRTTALTAAKVIG